MIPLLFYSNSLGFTRASDVTYTPGCILDATNYASVL